MTHMSYEEALAFIHGAYGKGEKQGLENMHALLSLLGNPHHSFRSVHVAGTNGKGSTCAFIQAALRCAGYRTGLYTSPFLQRFNERIRLDGIPIADETLAACTARVAEAVDMLRAKGIKPTEFEIGTAVAFAYFAGAGPDIAVIEVGLGGRLDPTNVITPLVSAITAIGLDHVRVLGDTPEAIAGEKAGIVKPGVPLVLSAQNPPAVRGVIQGVCVREGAPLIIAPEATGLPLGILGAHQRYNAGVAQAVLKLLYRAGFEALSDEAIAEGFAKARWPGRLEWLDTTPPILLDGAHNAHGVQALSEYMHTLSPAKTVLVCGILQDKDWQPMVEAFASFSDIVIAVSPDSKRALPVQALASAFEGRGMGQVLLAASSVSEGVETARSLAGPLGRVVIAGSLYLVGEARTCLLGTQDSLLASCAKEM